MCRPEEGFTLIELLVVIAIISILAGIMFPVFLAAKERARQTHCISSLHSISMMLSQYAVDHRGAYPPAIDNARDPLSVDPTTRTGLAVAVGVGKLQCPNDTGRTLGADFSYNNDSPDGTDPARNLYPYYGYLPNGYAADADTYDVDGSPPPEAGVTRWRDFPFLRSRQPPPYTIVTHCTFHRPLRNMDLALRLDGHVDKIHKVMLDDRDAKDRSSYTDGGLYRFNFVACRDLP